MLDRQNLLGAFASEVSLPLSDADAFPTHVSSVNLPDKIAEFRAKYQMYNLNRKAEASSVAEWQRKDAWDSFQVIQGEMKSFNESFRPTKYHRKAREIIRNLLPEFHFVQDDVWALCTFGPGTFHGAVRHALGSSTHYKIGGQQTVTRRARSLAGKVILKHFPNWAEHLRSRHYTLVGGNRPSHVPKDVRKCRPISIEPSLNVFLQQGVGRWLGRYMKRCGFADIHDGQAVNRRLAASLDNATIDLSNASDTISRALVEYLLPWDWFAVLDTIRSHEYDYRGCVGTYHNFSSQGNAFTFPLETLIFKAIVMAYTGLSRSEVTVYGDDIIVPVTHATRAVYGLGRSGFTVNTEKSYWGQHDDERRYFRESCGADWYRGQLVTPVYYRRDVQNLADLAVLHNRFCEEWPGLVGVQRFILDAIPPKARVAYGPRFFWSDRPEVFANSKSYFWTTGFNQIGTSYDSWFWTEGELEGVMPNSLGWSTVTREIAPKQFIDDRTAILTFLLKGCNQYPATASRKIKLRKRVVTPARREDGQFTKVGGRSTYVGRPGFNSFSIRS